MVRPSKTVAMVPCKFSYATDGTPPGYVCTDCGVTGVKLWREYQTFLDNQMLRCAVCAVKNQSASVKPDTVIGDDGKHDSEYGRTDQIGSLVPAVPTEENDTFWGYSSVPQPGCDWWYGLPNPCRSGSAKPPATSPSALAGSTPRAAR